MEISQMLEKAKAISDAVNNPSDENIENNNDSDNFKQAMQIVNLIKIMSEINKVNKEINSDDESIYEKKEIISEFEQDLQTPAIRTIKAAIPYLDFEYQKNIGIMIKIIELDNLIKKYRNTAATMDTGKKDGWQKDMLLAMKSELDKKNQYYIDMLVRFMDIKDIIAKLKLEENEDGTEI